MSKGETVKLTPMMRQFKAAKEQHPDAVLFFRRGDFYEMFLDDAELCSRILGLTLTSRSKEQNVPMCGFPWKAASGYVRKMLAAGHKVAICEQTEDPAQAKGLVKREVIRVITPGTAFEDDLIGVDANYLGAVARYRGDYAVAFLELSTGEMEVWPLDNEGKAVEVVSSVMPSEVIVTDGGGLSELDDIGPMITGLSSDYFRPADAESVLTSHFDVRALEGFGLGEQPSLIAATGALLRYATEVQPGSLEHIEAIDVCRPGERMFLDPETKRNLELAERIGRGDGGGTLFDLMNRSVTTMGARLMRKWLLAPLLDIAQIRARHAAVEEFYRRGDVREKVVSLLDGVADVERLAGRLALGTANPRDVSALGRSLERITPLREAIEDANSSLLCVLAEQLDDVEDVARRIGDAVADDPPILLTEGGIIRNDYDPNLDELRATVSEAKQYIAGLEATEREKTGIPSLKVGFNKVFGYYIEITRTHTDKTPDHYVRKQTLVNAERYITPELKEYENIVLTSDERTNDLEYNLFCDIRVELKEQVSVFKRIAAAAAALDVLAAFATVALEYDFGRPDLVEEPIIEIDDGRHPVVEKYYLDEPFIPNDTHLGNDKRFMVLTGPNMAGKSTYLRQVAIAVLLAQAGSFVPAKKAKLGIVDRVFTRIGAADDLSRGRSTFLVEMAETANIINNATENSLILLDEVGRGTSTYDGLSLAWAVSEYIAHNTKARTLFATHYHELAALAMEEELGVVNYTVLVKESGGKVHFMRRVAPGVTDRSYGVQVARLAGLPPQLLARARQLLSELEDGRAPSPGFADRDQTALFGGRLPVIEEYIAALDPEEMSPREALEAIYRLKELAEE
ncbi:MAG: DNA mismatch repair protein MutS [bacterium]|nr:DNA mismatch repair protein MutS [bacterium]